MKEAFLMATAVVVGSTLGALVVIWISFLTGLVSQFV